MTHKVGLIEGRNVYHVETGEAFRVHNSNDLFNVMFEDRRMYFVQDICNEFYFPFLDEIVAGNDASVTCTKRGQPSGIRARYKRESRWIGLPQRFGDYNADGPFSTFITKFGKYTGLGIRPTPSSYGVLSMQRTWETYNLPYVYATNGAATNFLKQHLGGGRYDSPAVGYRGNATYYDIVSAYLAYWGVSQPCGTSYNFRGSRVNQYVEYFAHCIVNVNSRLSLSPFRSGTGDSLGRAVYPTDVGVYECYLFKGEIEDCREVGCDVQILNGVGWKSSTEDGRFWAQDMFEGRWNAPDEEIADAMKMSAVSGVGRHATGGRYYILVSEENAGIMDIPVIDRNGDPHHWFVHEVCDPNPHSLLHWYGKTVSECNRALYKFALPFAEQGRLLATNADGVIVKDGDEHNNYVRKYSANYISVRPGTWVYTFLTDLFIRRPRWIEANEMVRRPGYKKVGRKVQLLEEED